MARVFFMSPLYHIVPGFAKLFHQRDRGPLDGSVPSVCRPSYQEQSKSKAKCTRGVRRAFSLSLILPGRRRTPKLPQAYCAGALPAGGASRYALRCESTTGPSSCRSCMPCKMSCRTSSRLHFAFSLCGLLGVRQVVSHNMVPCNNSGICPVALARPLRLDKSFSWLLAPYCVYCVNTSSVA